MQTNHFCTPRKPAKGCCFSDTSLINYPSVAVTLSLQLIEEKSVEF